MMQRDEAVQGHLVYDKLVSDRHCDANELLLTPLFYLLGLAVYIASGGARGYG